MFYMLVVLSAWHACLYLPLRTALGSCRCSQRMVYSVSYWAYDMTLLTERGSLMLNLVPYLDRLTWFHYIKLLLTVHTVRLYHHPYPG